MFSTVLRIQAVSIFLFCAIAAAAGCGCSHQHDDHSQNPFEGHAAPQSNHADLDTHCGHDHSHSHESSHEWVATIEDAASGEVIREVPVLLSDRQTGITLLTRAGYDGSVADNHDRVSLIFWHVSPCDSLCLDAYSLFRAAARGLVAAFEAARVTAAVPALEGAQGRWWCPYVLLGQLAVDGDTRDVARRGGPHGGTVFDFPTVTVQQAGVHGFSGPLTPPGLWGALEPQVRRLCEGLADGASARTLLCAVAGAGDSPDTSPDASHLQDASAAFFKALHVSAAVPSDDPDVAGPLDPAAFLFHNGILALD